MEFLYSIRLSLSLQNTSAKSVTFSPPSLAHLLSLYTVLLSCSLSSRTQQTKTACSQVCDRKILLVTILFKLCNLFLSRLCMKVGNAPTNNFTRRRRGEQRHKSILSSGREVSKPGFACVSPLMTRGPAPSLTPVRAGQSEPSGPSAGKGSAGSGPGFVYSPRANCTVCLSHRNHSGATCRSAANILTKT